MVLVFTFGKRKKVLGLHDISGEGRKGVDLASSSSILLVSFPSLGGWQAGGRMRAPRASLCGRARARPTSRPPLDVFSHLTAGPPSVWESECGPRTEIPLSHDAPRRSHRALH